MTDVYKAIQEFNQMRDTGETIDYSFGKETSIGLENGEKVRYSSFGEAMEGIGMTLTGIAGGATSATLGLPTDIAGLFVGIKDAVTAEEGKKIDAFVNGFTEFSKANLGSEYYRGVFDNFVDSFDVDPKLKEDAKSGFGAGEFGGVGGAVKVGVTKGPKVVKKGLEKIGEKAQQELDLDTGGATLSMNAVGKADKLIKQGLAKLKKPTDKEDGILAFHGSGADFDEFKLSKIGTGEGSQVFGYGLYFTDSKDIAKFYKNAELKSQNVEFNGKPIKFLSDSQDIDNKTVILGKIRDRILSGKHNSKSAINNVKFEYEQSINNSFDLSRPLNKIDKMNYDSMKSDLDYIDSLDANDFKYKSGKTYEVNIKTVTDNLINNDIPINEQSKNMQDKVQEIIKIMPFAENRFFKLDLNLNGGLFRQELESQVTAGINKIADNNVKRLKKEISQIDFEKMINEDPFLKLVNSKMLDDKTVTEYIGNPLGSTPKIASEIMNDFGIKGIKYKSGQLTKGQKDSKATNFVIFDDKIIDIIAKYGIVGPVAVSSLGLSKQGDADES